MSMKTELIKEKSKKVPGYKNPMQTPKILKVVISTGVGSFKDKTKNKIVEDRLARITGQQATLRGERMYDFLDKLVHISLPRTKDFRGISPTSADEMGNYTLGIKEHTIFPETADEELKDVFGFAITIVTSAKSKSEVVDLLSHLGFPFKK